jgi:hypothetical protein
MWELGKFQGTADATTVLLMQPVGYIAQALTGRLAGQVRSGQVSSQLVAAAGASCALC